MTDNTLAGYLELAQDSVDRAMSYTSVNSRERRDLERVYEELERLLKGGREAS